MPVPDIRFPTSDVRCPFSDSQRNFAHSAAHVIRLSKFLAPSCMAELRFLRFLQIPLDTASWSQYGFAEITMHLTRPLSSNNPGNNRPLPQNLWDVIDRSGMSVMR